MTNIKASGCFTMPTKVVVIISTFLGVTDDVDDVYFYGYGVHYDYQLKKLEIISSEYPSDFYIYYPDNVTIINEKDVKKEVLKLLAEELDELLDSDNG